MTHQNPHLDQSAIDLDLDLVHDPSLSIDCRFSSHPAPSSNLKDIFASRGQTLLSKMVVHISALVFPCIMIYSAVPGSSLFSWHPILMSVGFSLLIVESIIIFSRSSSLFPSMARPDKASLHYVLAGAGVSAVTAGFVVIYLNKEQAGKPHFTTWHGLLGVITVGYASVQALAGTVQKYYKYTGKYIGIRLADMKLYHATSGLCLFVFATVTFLLSLYSNWASKNLHWVLWYVCFACISSCALVVMMHITSTYLPQATGASRAQPGSSTTRAKQSNNRSSTS